MNRLHMDSLWSSLILVNTICMQVKINLYDFRILNLHVPMMPHIKFLLKLTYGSRGDVKNVKS